VSDIGKEIDQETKIEMCGDKKRNDVLRVYIQGPLLFLHMATEKGEKIEVYRRVRK
jgi:hypothetical protein